jgi:hypothetical protein
MDHNKLLLANLPLRAAAGRLVPEAPIFLFAVEAMADIAEVPLSSEYNCPITSDAVNFISYCNSYW